MKEKTEKLFMAFATGKESKESAPVKKYIGNTSVFVKGVNPTKKELEEFYDTTIDKDPEYRGTVEVEVAGEKKTVNTVRIDFLTQTNVEKCGIDSKNKLTFFLRDMPQVNKDGSKCKIIDKYGRTAWATKEEVNNKQIPQYSNGPANIDADYRPCFVGEEELTDFIKNYLSIDSIQVYVDGKWIQNPNVDPKDCEARLDNIKDYFKGDFSELKTIVSLQPTNQIKVTFGIKNSNDGKQYQTVYSNKTVKLNARTYDAIHKDITERKNAGALSMEEYQDCDLREYTVTPTSFETQQEPENPFVF